MKDSNEYLEFLENSFSEEKSQLTTLFEEQRSQHSEFVTEFRSKLNETNEEVNGFIDSSKAEIEKKLTKLDKDVSKRLDSITKSVESELANHRSMLNDQQKYVERVEMTLAESIDALKAVQEHNNERFERFSSKLTLLTGVITVLTLSNFYLIISN